MWTRPDHEPLIGFIFMCEGIKMWGKVYSLFISDCFTKYSVSPEKGQLFNSISVLYYKGIEEQRDCHSFINRPTADVEIT